MSGKIRFHLGSLCLCSTLFRQGLPAAAIMRAKADIDQSWLHNYHNNNQYLTNGPLSHVRATICSLSVHFSHTISILTAYVWVCAQTPPILSMLRNLLACQHRKTWKRSSARVHHALNILLAASTIGEQSRHYFKTLWVNSGMHYLIYNHVKDSVHAIYWSSVVPVSMDPVYDINRLQGLESHTQQTLLLSYGPRCELFSLVGDVVGSKGS